MQHIITIDQGNTAVKVVVFADGSPVEKVRIPGRVNIEHLLPLIEKYSPVGVAYGSVAHVDAKLVESLRHLCEGGDVLLVTQGTPFPISINYDTKETLGIDRIAGAVGAAKRHPGTPLLVVDAGTAITIDVVDGSNTLRGGNISPGVELRFKALNSYTDALPLCSYVPEVEPFGTDTHTAIQAGVQWGVKSEIEAAYAKAKKLYGAEKVILTGGDAPNIAKMLEIDNNEIDIVEDLVSHGIYHIYDFNHNDETI